MKTKKLIILVLFEIIIGILFIPKSVYGYNLTFETRFTSNNSDLNFYIGSGSSQHSRDIYSNANIRKACDTEEWGYLLNNKNRIGSNQWNFNICEDIFNPEKNRPTTTNYISQSYIFYADEYNTSKYYYGSAPSPYVMVSYLNYDLNENNKYDKYADVIPYEAYVKYGDAHVKAYTTFISSKGNPSINFPVYTYPAKEIRTRTQILSNGVNLDELSIPNERLGKINEALDNEIENSSNENNGNAFLRYSAVLWTEYKGTHKNIDSAWEYYQLTQMNGGIWGEGTRGCASGDSDHTCNDAYADKSTLNEFDNVIKIPYSFSRRKIYVRHIDADTHQLIPNAGNATSVDGVKSGSDATAYSPYNLPSQEYYTIAANKGITLSKTKLTETSNGKLVYLGYKRGTNKDINQAKAPLNNQYMNTSGTVNIAATNDSDYTYVDFYYKVNKSTPNIIETKGRLLFKSDDYQDTTSSDEADYIPSGESIRPYISDAYPYLLNRLTYKVEDAKPQTTYQTYHYTYWKEIYNWKTKDNPIDPKTGKPEIIDGKSYTYVLENKSYPDYHPIVAKQNNGNYTYYSDGRINYKEYTHTITTTHTITVPVRYYRITNLSMWRISSAILQDLDSNKGGKLFDNGKDQYEISTSASYNSRSTPNIVHQTYRVYPVCNDNVGMEYNANCDIHTSVSNSYATVDGKNIVEPTQIPDNVQKVTDTYQHENENGSISKELAMVDATTTTNDYTANTKYFVYPGKAMDTSGGDTFSNPFNISLTRLSDFNTNLTIPKDRYNGTRAPWAQIKYKAYVIHNENGGTNMHSDYYLGLDDRSTALDKDLNNVTDKYDEHDNDPGKKPNNKVDIFTPIALDDPDVTSESFVNHTNLDSMSIIQKNSEFTITPKSSVNSFYGIGTKRFIRNYYITLDFDIINAKVGDDYIGNANAGTVIKVPNGESLKAKSVGYEGAQTVGQLKNKIHISASAYNTPEALERDVAYNGADYIDEEENENRKYDSALKQIGYLKSSIKGDANHMAWHESYTTNLSRIYDFKVTDCADVNWKQVFRDLTNDGKVNSLTNKVYYAGINKWDMTSGVDENYIVLRDDLGAGATGSNSSITPRRILPLGPYKHDPTTYTSAPKLGYRFSFDLKTTGYMSLSGNNKREIQITPTFFYISKDGKTFKRNDQITLYYKNTTGKYIPFLGSNYTLYFKPNDGYRYIYNEKMTPDTSRLSTKLEPLVIGSNDGSFKLGSNMMATRSDDFIQSWYGEYKLPNSTIAVLKDKSIYDKDAVLTDGYIGVAFKIECIDYEGSTKKRVTSYNQNDTNKANSANTTQWDYEGFLGFRNPGTKITSDESIKVQLEKGTWSVYDDNNDYKYNTYQQVKGCVVLYDADARAAQDFD